MFQAKAINADHRDLIHDVAYDFYGNRMATCSSDQSVKVFDLDEKGEWRCTANWKAHSGSVWKVTWAHPEFGQILATCSFDRTAVLWEEVVGDSSNDQRPQSHWVKRTSLVDSRTSVTDVKFAPKHLGLLLATCSADGIVRIYEASDIMNLSQWCLLHELSVKLPCSCLSWNPSLSRLHPPMIAVGSDDPNPSVGGKVFIYEYSENTHRWAKIETLSGAADPVHDIAFAPNLGRSYHLLAIASKDVRIFTLKPTNRDSSLISGQSNVVATPSQAQGSLSQLEIQQAGQFDDHHATVWRIAWNITGTILASSGDDGCLRLWKANYLNTWKCIAVLKGDGSAIQTESSESKAGYSAQNLASLGPALAQTTTTRTAQYYKAGSISNQKEVPWH